MWTPSRHWSRLASVLKAPPAGAEERARLSLNLRVSLLAGALGSGLGAVSNLWAGREGSPLVLVVLCGLCLLGLWLLHRGHPTAAALVTLPGMILAIDVMLVLGLGIHDRAALLFPVVILVAALALDRRLLVLTTVLCVLSAVVVVALQRWGYFTPRLAADPGWLPFVDTTIILVITAIAAHVLVADAVRSLSARRESEARLAAANLQLGARNAELERFAHVVSHDLRSPLVTIRGFLDYIEKDARAGDVSRLEADLGRVRAAAERMADLLSDLLELSRTGRIVRPHEPVPLAEVVHEAKGLVAGRLSARGVQVEVEPPLPVVRADRSQLVALAQNLLENAARFMGAQPAPVVRIGSRPGKGTAREVVVFVSDNGIGIDPAHHERVFGLFHRLDPRGEGTGLGLALARRIVEEHGGRIWVESEGLGRGSTFCFTLPREEPGGPSAQRETVGEVSLSTSQSS